MHHLSGWMTWAGPVLAIPATVAASIWLTWPRSTTQRSDRSLPAQTAGSVLLPAYLGTGWLGGQA